MTIKRIIGAAVAGVLVAVAGVAAASDFSSSAHTAFFASGNHQFYVWCAGGADYMAQQSGANAADAQMRLYNSVKAQGRTTCWPVWQGRVSD
jgi:heme exporter protein D